MILLDSPIFPDLCTPQGPYSLYSWAFVAGDNAQPHRGRALVEWVSLVVSDGMKMDV